MTHKIKIVAKQHIFRGDGAVGFQLEHPMTVRLAIAQQALRRRIDARLERATSLGSNCAISGMHLP